MWWSSLKMRVIITALMIVIFIGCQEKVEGDIVPKTEKVTKKTEEVAVDNFDNDFELSKLKRVNRAGIQMKNTFPFSQAAKIEIISFPADKFRSSEAFQNYDIVDGKMQFDESIILQRIVLNKSQIENLFDILYEYKETDEFRGADCYNPNHRVIFYDNKGKIIAFLELCFICEGYKLSLGFTPEKIYHTKFNQLETYFKSVGVNHFFEELE